MPTSLLAGLATGAAGTLASRLFSSIGGGVNVPAAPNVVGAGANPSQTLQGFRIPGFNAGGINATFGDNSFGVTADPSRAGAVGGIASTFGAQADSLNPLLARVAPGFGDLRASRLAEIENARQKSLGDLRENLGRRRVLGSSFAQDSVSRTEAEFAQEREKAQAESFLQEMEMTHQLQQEQFTARRAEFQTGLDEMNLEAGLAASLTGKATDVLSKNTELEAQLQALSNQTQAQLQGTRNQTQAQLQALSEQGAGRFFGQAMGGTTGQTNTALRGFFGGGGGDAGFFGGSPASNPNLVPIGA